MKILFCSPTRLDRTLGAPKVIIELAEGLTHLGCQCKLIGPKDIIEDLVDGRNDPDRYAAALRKYLLKHAAEYDVVDYDHEYLPYDRSEFPATCLMVARSVLLHYHFDEIKIPAPRTLRSTVARMVRHVLGTDQHRRNRIRADKTGKEADMFITLNSQDRDTLVNYGYERSKIAVVGLGLHPERYAALCNACLDVPPEPRIAFVGTFDYRKGCLDMPGIVAGVARAVPNVRFRLIGTAGLFKTEAEVLSHFPESLRSNVEVIPRFKPEDLPGLLEACSAGVFPSYIEGFGFGVLEMLAAGLPVVAYDAPGPPDMLPKEYLTPRGDVAATAGTLVDLLKNSAKLKQARIEARERAKSFTWKRAAKQTLDAFIAARDAKNSQRVIVTSQHATQELHIGNQGRGEERQMSGINIVCAADERFAMPLAVTLRSAAANCSRPVRAFVLNTELSEKTRRSIENAIACGSRTPTIIWLDAEHDYMSDVPVGLQHLSHASYLRLAMGRMLPPDVERVIYLDSDVLVVKDLVELWDTPLEGRLVGAVRDFLTPVAGRYNALEYCLAETGISPMHPMFNTGVLLLDLEAYRAKEVETRCVDFLHRWRDQLRSADQDAINAILHDQVKSLDLKWNVQVGGWGPFKTCAVLSDTERQAVREVEPAILHFSGAGKPWNSGLRSPLCKVYLENVDRTGWYGQTGFRLWKAKRLAICVRTGALNRFDAIMANFKPPVSMERPA